MNATLPTPTVSPADSLLWHGSAAPCAGTFSLHGRPERLWLARILQRLSVPEVEVHAVRFVAAAGDGDSHAEVDFAASAARARLLQRRIAQLPGVHAVALRFPAAPR